MSHVREKSRGTVLDAAQKKLSRPNWRYPQRPVSWGRSNQRVPALKGECRRMTSKAGREGLGLAVTHQGAQIPRSLWGRAMQKSAQPAARGVDKEHDLLSRWLPGLVSYHIQQSLSPQRAVGRRAACWPDNGDPARPSRWPRASLSMQGPACVLKYICGQERSPCCQKACLASLSTCLSLICWCVFLILSNLGARVVVIYRSQHKAASLYTSTSRLSPFLLDFISGMVFVCWCACFEVGVRYFLQIQVCYSMFMGDMWLLSIQ